MLTYFNFHLFVLVWLKILDGTTNFAHGYPSFSVSIGVLYRGKPAAATVVIVNSFINNSLFRTCWSKHQTGKETSKIELFIDLILKFFVHYPYSYDLRINSNGSFFITLGISFEHCPLPLFGATLCLFQFSLQNDRVGLDFKEMRLVLRGER